MGNKTRPTKRIVTKLLRKAPALLSLKYFIDLVNLQQTQHLTT